MPVTDRVIQLHVNRIIELIDSCDISVTFLVLLR